MLFVSVKISAQESTVNFIENLDKIYKNRNLYYLVIPNLDNANNYWNIAEFDSLAIKRESKLVYGKVQYKNQTLIFDMQRGCGYDWFYLNDLFIYHYLYYMTKIQKTSITT
jgi:hypothetical protein